LYWSCVTVTTGTYNVLSNRYTIGFPLNSCETSSLADERVDEYSYPFIFLSSIDIYINLCISCYYDVSAVGFGDIVPRSTAGKVFTIFYVLSTSQHLQYGHSNERNLCVYSVSFVIVAKYLFVLFLRLRIATTLCM